MLILQFFLLGLLIRKGTRINCFVSDAYFLNLQSDIDLWDAKKNLSGELSAIKPYTEV